MTEKTTLMTDLQFEVVEASMGHGQSLSHLAWGTVAPSFRTESDTRHFLVTVYGVAA